jgi:aryl-alcohol dehydrogenase-like predicted oxidoreductase
MKLALGTVQFGLNYGVTNQQGKVSLAEVEKILSFAKSEGITTLDTAAAYGDSEDVLGKVKASEHFNLVTKVPELTTQSLSLTHIVKNSLSHLACNKVTALLFHHADDLLSPGGQAYFNQASALKEQGLINQLGISVYRPEQVVNISQHFNLDIIQIPMSWFDQRFLTKDIQKNLTDIEVHVRSIFLQGILLAELNSLPTYFAPFKEKFKCFHQYCKSLNCQPLTLALAIIHQNNFIDKAVIGCCSLAQLEQITEHYYIAKQLVKENKGLMQNIGKKLASNNEALIDPSQWNISN